MPITYGIPPYGFFEQPAEQGSIPPHRTDCGTFLLAENIGVRSLIFLKDEKRLFEKDAKKVPESKKAERYIQPSILMALKIKPSYGYELIHEISQFGFVEGQALP